MAWWAILLLCLGSALAGGFIGFCAAVIWIGQGMFG
jgi:hypothetical protein